MTFTTKTRWAKYDGCFLQANQYADNCHIALSVWSYEEGPIADLTVNIGDTRFYSENCGFVDTNNFPDGIALIEQLGIGKPTGIIGYSGFCSYPLYEFNLEAIEKYTGR